MARRPSYYWDSSVFAAWIKDERREPGDVRMACLAGIVAEIESREAVLVTSVLAFSEILEGNLDAEQRQRFERLFYRSNIEIIDVTPPIARHAGALREHCRSEGVPGPGHEDALHLATAQMLDVDEFHTFDPNHLALAEHLPDFGPEICEPSVSQLPLDF